MTEFINDDLSQIETEPESYHLRSDNDGHWYVILDGEDENFDTWVDSDDEDCEYDFSDCILAMHPSSVHFRYYWIE